MGQPQSTLVPSSEHEASAHAVTAILGGAARCGRCERFYVVGVPTTCLYHDGVFQGGAKGAAQATWYQPQGPIGW